MPKVEPPTASQGVPKGAPGPDAVIYLNVPPYRGLAAGAGVGAGFAAGVAGAVAAGAVVAAGAGLAVVVGAADGLGDGVVAGVPQPITTAVINRETRRINSFFNSTSLYYLSKTELILLRFINDVKRLCASVDRGFFIEYSLVRTLLSGKGYNKTITTRGDEGSGQEIRYLLKRSKSCG